MANSKYKSSSSSSSLWSKKFQVKRDKGKVALEVFLTVRALSTVSSSLGIKKCTMTSFVTLGIWSEGNAPKNWEPTVSVSFTIILHHTGRFWSRIS
jgi:hypothetical protein